jgi:hypothetical protein
MARPEGAQSVHTVRTGTIDVLVVGLGGKKTEINDIDPYTAEKIGSSRLRVRKLTVDEALRKYGHDNHHYA